MKGVYTLIIAVMLCGNAFGQTESKDDYSNMLFDTTKKQEDDFYVNEEMVVKNYSDTSVAKQLLFTRHNLTMTRKDVSKAGYKIYQYTRQKSIGTILTLTGATTVGIAAVGNFNTNIPYFVGGGLGIIGFFISNVIAPSKLKEAAILLNGTGVGIPINYKKTFRQ